MTEAGLTAKERAFIRTEFMARFGEAPRLTDGVIVKRWVTGPNRGRPKPGPAIQGMVDRGLLSLVDDGSHWLRAHFTELGREALRHMAQDRRALPPAQYQHLIDELQNWAPAGAAPSCDAA